MIEINNIYNEDCFITMSKMDKIVDVILTSPPYNMTKRKGGPDDKGRYDVYRDWKDEQEYLGWSINLFDNFDKVLKRNGVVLYNFSYSIENPSLPYKLISYILQFTNFEVVDTITWKKPTSMPHPASYNRLNRICEFVFVLSRKKETKTFKTNKQITKTSSKGQKYYEIVDNFIEAKNNDGANPLNKATFSTELCDKLLSIYAQDGMTIYDPFMGIGTTSLSCKKRGLNWVGSEISKEQIDYARH